MHSFALLFIHSFNRRLACSYTVYSAPGLYLDLISPLQSCILSFIHSLPICVHLSRECILFNSSFPCSSFLHIVHSPRPPPPTSLITAGFSTTLSWMKLLSFCYSGSVKSPLSSRHYVQVRFFVLLFLQLLQILSGVTDLGRSPFNVHTSDIYALMHSCQFITLESNGDLRPNSLGRR